MAEKLEILDTSSDTESDSDTSSDDSIEIEKCLVYFKGDSEEPFKLWLDNSLPSQTRRDKGYRWVGVVRPDGEKRDDEKVRDIGGLCRSYMQLRLAGEAVTFQTIKDLAIKYNVVSGKWLLFTSQGGKVDHLWSLIASSIINDDIPCFSAKVSTHDDDDNSHVICIYNNDFTNFEEVMGAEKAIRKMGIKGKLMYKPDVYTNLGIYAGNSHKIHQFIMISQYHINTGSSEIKSFV